MAEAWSTPIRYLSHLTRIFNDSRWRSLADWKADLAQHYETAKQMMGVTTARCQAETDHLLRDVAQDMGREETYHPTEVAVFFGDPGKTVPDPNFGGTGPDRAGCTLCGGCMVGCRHNAKNTLDKELFVLCRAARGADHSGN